MSSLNKRTRPNPGNYSRGAFADPDELFSDDEDDSGVGKKAKTGRKQPSMPGGSPVKKEVARTRPTNNQLL